LIACQRESDQSISGWFSDLHHDEKDAAIMFYDQVKHKHSVPLKPRTRKVTKLPQHKKSSLIFTRKLPFFDCC
jgi:hypothetical protein